METGESVNIVPQEELTDNPDRWYWDSPLIISPHSSTRLYFASQRVYRSDDRGNSWRIISGDLSQQIDRNRLKLMDRVWSVDAIAKNASSSFFGAIVTLAKVVGSGRRQPDGARPRAPARGRNGAAGIP